MKDRIFGMPRKLALILFYMFVIFCVILAEMEYARRDFLAERQLSESLKEEAGE